MREMIIDGVKLRRCCGQAPVMRRIYFKTSVYYEVECTVTASHKTGLCDSIKAAAWQWENQKWR